MTLEAKVVVDTIKQTYGLWDLRTVATNTEYLGLGGKQCIVSFMKASSHRLMELSSMYFQ